MVCFETLNELLKFHMLVEVPSVAIPSPLLGEWQKEGLNVIPFTLPLLWIYFCFCAVYFTSLNPRALGDHFKRPG